MSKYPLGMKLAPIRRHVFEPLYYLKAGSPRLPYWRKLEQTQFYSRARLEEIQWNRLRDLWSFLWKSNDYYRRRFVDAGLREQDLQSVADISRLPVLTKKEIRDHGTAMLSDGYRQDELLNFKTGGSTGKALGIFLTEECSELRNACARRHDRWTGWEPGEPIGAVWGNPKLPHGLHARLVDACVQPHIYLDTMSVTDDAVRRFADEWKEMRPSLLFGHAHSLFLLSQRVEALDIDGITPTGILSTSMMLVPHERAVIERVFGRKVTDRYGCEEVSLIASECEVHKGMHMNIEHLVIEFIKDDGSAARAGEPGRIVVTDLMNKAMPFVRYQVEDVGVPMEGTCTCGRGLPLMGNVAGRMADFLVRRDGSKVAGVSLIENTLTRIPNVDQMQIVQEDMDTLRLNVVPGKQFGVAERRDLVEYFQGQFGANVAIELREVTEILPEKSGKYRFSICNVRLS